MNSAALKHENKIQSSRSLPAGMNSKNKNSSPGKDEAEGIVFSEKNAEDLEDEHLQARAAWRSTKALESASGSSSSRDQLGEPSGPIGGAPPEPRQEHSLAEAAAAAGGGWTQDADLGEGRGEALEHQALGRDVPLVQEQEDQDVSR